MSSIIAEIQNKGFDSLIENMREASNETKKLASTLEEAQKKLSELPKGSKEYKELEKELKAVTVAQKAQAQSLDSLKAEYRKNILEVQKLERVLNELETAGSKNTNVYKDIKREQEKLKRETGELKDQIGDLNAEISTLGSDTKNLDKGIRAISTFAGGFQAVQGAQALFGTESKKLEETLVRLNAVMAITQGLQTIQEELSKKDSLFTLAAAKAKRVLSVAIGQASTALKILRGVFVSIGIGAIIILVTTLISNFDKLTSFVQKLFPSLGNLGDKFKELKEKAISFIKNGVGNLINSFVDLYNNSLAVRGVIVGIGIAFKSLVDLVVLGGKNIVTVFSTLGQAILNPTKAFKILKNGFGEIFDNFKDFGKSVKENIEKGAEIANNSRLNKIDINTLFDKEKDKKISEDKGKSIAKDVKKGVKQEFSEPLEVPVPDIKFENVQEIAGNLLDMLNKQIQEAEKDLIAEFSINPNSESLEPLSARLRDLIKQAEQFKKRLEFIKNGSPKPDILGDLEIPQDVNIKGEIDFNPDEVSKNRFQQELGNLFNIDFSDPKFNIKLTDNLLSTFSNLSSNFFSIAKNASDARLAILEDEKNRGVISEKKYQEEVRKEKIKQAKIAKAEAIFNIGINIAEAITKAAAQGGIAGIALGAVMAAIGFAQLAIVAAKPIPQFYKGVIDLPLGTNKKGRDTIPAMLHEGESVMTADETKKHKPLFKAIRENKYERFMMQQALEYVKSFNMIPDIYYQIPRTDLLPTKSKSSDKFIFDDSKIVDELYWIKRAIKDADKNNISELKKNINKVKNGY